MQQISDAISAVPAWTVVGAGLLAGAAIGFVVARALSRRALDAVLHVDLLTAAARRRDALAAAWWIPTGIAASGLLAGAIAAGQLTLIRAAGVIVAGGIALAAAAHAIARLSGGAPIELRSEWSGLGGGVGGWQLSPVVGLLVLAIGFGGATVSLTARPEGNGCTGAALIEQKGPQPLASLDAATPDRSLQRASTLPSHPPAADLGADESSPRER